MSDNGGPAFPINSPSGTPEYMPQRDGMSLRDWFAGQALHVRFGERGSSISFEEMANHCYLMADAMLAARSAEAPTKETLVGGS
jgi:hypothetical protein